MKKIFFTMLVAIFSGIGLRAQDLVNDITARYSQGFAKSNENRVGLEYRRYLHSHFKLKFGADYGKNDKNIWLANHVLYGSDSVTITRDLALFSKNYSFYAGIDYEQFDYFSFGASFIIGTNQTLFGAFDRGARYNPESKTWENCLECVYQYHGEALGVSDQGSGNPWQYGSAIKTINYLTYGLSLRAGIRVPIKTRFELSMGYEPAFIRSKQINETNHQSGENTYSYKISESNAIMHRATFLLRYKF